MPPVAKKAVPAEVKPAESKMDVTAADSEPVVTEPAPDEAPPAETAEAKKDGPVLTEIEKPDPDLVNIAEPCPACYPQGWFEGATDGARASCPHLSVVFGEFLALERAQAIELGYEDRSAK